MTARQLRRVTVGMLMAMTLAAGTAVFAGTIERVNAFQTDVWQARVSAGVPVTVTVDGGGRATWTWSSNVYDSNGTLVAFDDDFSDYCIGAWTPRFSGIVTIRIVNRGGVYNRYVINVRWRLPRPTD